MELKAAMKASDDELEDDLMIPDSVELSLSIAERR